MDNDLNETLHTGVIEQTPRLFETNSRQPGLEFTIVSKRKYRGNRVRHNRFRVVIIGAGATANRTLQHGDTVLIHGELRSDERGVLSIDAERIMPVAR